LIQSATRFLGRHSHVNWALADQTMVSGVNFLTGILLARYLGLEEFGRFTLVWMAVLFGSSIHHTMINTPMMSIGPKQSEAEAPTYYGAVIIQEVVFSCLIFLLLFGGARLSGMLFPEWRVEGLALPLAFAALAYQLQDFIRRYFFTRGRAAAAFANDAIRYLGQVTVLIWMYMFLPEAMDTAQVLWIIAITAAVSVGFGTIFVERIEVKAKTLSTMVSRHWHFSKWLTASGLMQWATANAFTIMAGALLGTWAVGALRAAQNIMGVIHILFMGLENIVPARAARKFHMEGKKALCDYLKRVAQLGGGATATLALIAAAAPELWLRLVFGLEYQGYGYLLQCYAAIYLVMFLRFPLTAGLRAIEKPKVIFRANAWVTLLSLLAVYPLTAHLGLAGVIGGTLVVNFIQLLILWFGLKKQLG
jgi:O-antigen/teichoic acid export membrane protein